MSDQAVPDKQLLYGDFRDAEKDRRKLAMRAAHKALDIADDDMQVNANQTHTHNGVGAKGLALAALAAGMPGALLAGALMLKPSPAQSKADPPPAKAEQQPAPAAPAAKAREWDALIEEQQPDGTWKLIRRERLKTKE